MSRLFLGAYWSARKESIDECADRLLSFFGDLAKCDDSLIKWYELAGSRQQALERRSHVESREYLIRQLRRGSHSFDSLGFTIGLWNGGDESQSVALSVTCGSYHETLGNCVTLNFPEDLGSLVDFRRMRGVLAVVARTWEPDWAGVASEQAKSGRGFDPCRPFVDWMIYISNALLPKVPTFEPPTSTEHLPTGTIIVVQDEPPDPCNPLHLESIRRVRDALRGVAKTETGEGTTGG
jgi:hypothetical protein